MDYEHLVRDFAARTRHNLALLRRLKQEGHEVYEVTALINSLLGLPVFPQQRFIDRIPRKPLADLQAEGWPLPEVVGQFPHVNDLHELVRYLRNAVSHFNLKFESDHNGEISGLQVWNVHPRTGRTTWRGRFSLSEVEGVAERIVDLILQGEAA